MDKKKITLLANSTLRTHWRIMLAIDWADHSRINQQRAFDFILGLSKQIRLSVEPVSLMTRQTRGEKEASAHLRDLLINELRNQIRRSLNLDDPHRVSELQTIELKSDRMNPAIEGLHDEAVRKKIDLIVTATHGKQGWQRLIHSSFVEKLLLHSHIPVLSVGPHFQDPRSIQHILFPTNLTDDSRVVLRKMIPFATALGANVTIFHSLPTPREQKPSNHILPLKEAKPTLPGAWQSDLEKHEEQARTFIDAIRSAGGNANLFLDCSGMDLLQAIEDYQSLAHVDMIAIAAQSGPISNYFTGMTTRKLVRNSSCPVWCLHEHPSAFLVEVQTESPELISKSAKTDPAA